MYVYVCVCMCVFGGLSSFLYLDGGFVCGGLVGGREGGGSGFFLVFLYS